VPAARGERGDYRAYDGSGAFVGVVNGTGQRLAAVRMMRTDRAVAA